MGFPSWLRKEINRNIETLIHYPDPGQKEIRKAAARHFSISTDRVICGNGASEFISILPDILGIDHIIIPVPSYSEYEKHAGKVKISYLKLKEEKEFTLNLDELNDILDSSMGKKLIFIGQPNNPTGKSIPISEIEDLAEKHKDTFFCIDESFADFIPGYRSIAKTAIAVRNIPNIIVIRSMTKFYGIPGLRLGICIGEPGIIKKIKEAQIPWSVNSLALKVGEKLFDDHQFFKDSVKAVTILRTKLNNKLEAFSWVKVFHGEANFLLIKITDPKVRIEKLYNYLTCKGIIIRLCDNFIGLDDSYFRIAVRTSRENEKLINSLASFKEGTDRGTEVPPITKKRALPLMIQGTASNAGKSVLTAGLCRILYQDGYAVAPFKAQNMSNNSAVTLEGKEIGRAQALQAKACNINPDVRMNPVLLKPSSEKGSQVILNGLPAGNMTVKNWKEFKQAARAIVEENYNNLASEYDVIIIEGAGSPGEVNLKENDIVNMGMARYANAPVLIAGDIDRGGVFASFIGTMAVFEEWERNLIKGFIVNRFRGDATLLGSAHDYLSEYTGKPVLGTVPFIPELNLPEEDSVSLKDGSYFTLTKSEEQSAPSIIRIGLIDLPYISNFTDMDPLMQEQDIRIVLIKTPEDLESKFDCLIIPGSKNTSSDLSWLTNKGFPGALKNMKEKGVTIIGICGGFQMLGQRIMDPEYVELSIESSKDFLPGLGMIDIETTFYPEKQLAHKEVLHTPSACNVRGYEIHHGISRLKKGKVIIESNEGLLGASSIDGKIWGTYLHGIFDADEFRQWFLNQIRKDKGIPISNKQSLIYDIDASLNRLADVLRESLDINLIKSIIGL